MEPDPRRIRTLPTLEKFKEIKKGSKMPSYVDSVATNSF